MTYSLRPLRRNKMNKTTKAVAIALAFSFAASMSMLAPSLAQAKDTIKLGVVLEPPHLDPTAGAAAAIDEIVYANIFQGLTRIDRNGEVQPALAESWEVSDDGKVYTFKLQKSVKFHDGTDFDADDVKFSLERATSDKSENAQKALFSPIDKVEVVDPTTVKITLKQPSGNFLFNMAWGDAVMVAPESADNNKTSPVGTGPFKFSNWNKGSSVEIVRNDDYWGDRVELASASFNFIPDPAAAVSSMLAGDVDGFPIFPAPEALPQFEANPAIAVVSGTTEGETILAINNAKKPFDDLRVRRAISHAIDRKAIIDGAMFGQGTPIGTHFAPHHPAYVDLVNTYPYDLEKAKALLKEAGIAEGTKITLKLPPPAYARRGGEIISDSLRKIGFDVEIIPVEWAQWLEQVFKGKDFDLTIVSHTEPMDIGIYAKPDYYFGYSNPDFKAIMDTLDATQDTKERYKLMGDAQRKITEDAVNAYLFELAKTGVWNAKIEGLWHNSPIQANDLTEVKWKE